MFNISRRSFLTTSATISAGLLLEPSYVFSKSYLSNGNNPVLRVGIIGMGQRGTGIASIINKLPQLHIVACCDTMEENLRKGLALSEAGAKGYRNYEQLLADKQVDAVIIALPLHLHYSVAAAALDAGKHVYLEKTMTHSSLEALRLEEKVKQYPTLTFQVGFQYRYFGLYHKIAEILEQKWLGDVMQYECQYHRNSDWRRPVLDGELERQINWRMYKEYSGGLMAELCSHQIDIVNWFTGGHPQRVVAVGGIDYWKDGRDTYDNIRAIFEYPNGVKASVSSILSNAYRGYSIRILGTKGTIEIQQSKAYIYREASTKTLSTVDGVTRATVESWGQGEKKVVEFNTPDGRNLDPTAYALMGFVESIYTGRTPLANIECGKLNAIAVHLANQAAYTGCAQVWSS